MLEWIETHGATLAVISGAMLVLGVVAVPWIIIRLPEDALIRRNPLDVLGDRHPALRIVLFVTRNVIALPLLILGVIMLVTPGQGILTILLALILAEFPGKAALEHHLVTRKPVFASLNWIRDKGGKPPFISR